MIINIEGCLEMNSEYILTVHDELLSNLILLNCNNIVYNDNLPSKVATIKGKRVDISLVATSDDKYKKFIKKRTCFLCFLFSRIYNTVTIITESIGIPKKRIPLIGNAFKYSK